MIYILIFFLIIIGLITYNYDRQENASFALDQLNISQNPELLNEIDARNQYRIIGIDKNIKMDKNGRIEYITYAKPNPEAGESSCYKTKCPSWVTNVICWQCL